VVEDDQDTAETLRSLLDLCGYLVVVARTSQQGIEAARQMEPHIVLCDIGLPDSDGYIVGSVLRQSGATAGARLIAVTGQGGPQNRPRDRFRDRSQAQKRLSAGSRMFPLLRGKKDT